MSSMAPRAARLGSAWSLVWRRWQSTGDRGATFRSVLDLTELEVLPDGTPVRVQGWLRHGARMSANLAFFRLQSVNGRVCQLLTRGSSDSDECRRWHGIPEQSVVTVDGIVREAPEAGRRSQRLREIQITDMTVLNAAEPLPFHPSVSQSVTEQTRYQNRHLDLRNPETMRPLLLRSKILQCMRNYMASAASGREFVEVDTPVLFKSTPEGARELLIPSRTYHGEFYSLVQSPQQWKQILMAAGFGGYYQVAKCFRDEDGRKDRQLEFSQLDMEMSFISGPEDVMRVIEGLVDRVWTTFVPGYTGYGSAGFPQYTYRHVMDMYGSDKPDLRIPYQIVPLARHDADQLSALVVPDGAVLSSRVKKDIAEASRMPLHSLEFVKGGNLAANSKLLQSFGVNTLDAGVAIAQLDEKDLVVISKQPADIRGGSTALGRARPLLYQAMTEKGKVKPLDDNEFKFLWVIDFPLFTPSVLDDGPGQRGSAGIQSTHHPFTAPHPDDSQALDTDPLSVRGQHYDLVVNGVELGGGSLRIHQAEMQQKVFRHILKIPPAREQEFSQLIKALQSGCPPHGGMALGLDRLVALVCKVSSIRDVIAFPKSAGGRDLLVGAPSRISATELEEYGLQLMTHQK